MFDLRRLMKPASIAVVGATDRHGSYAAQVLLNLDAIGYPGEVWGINPGRREALGRVCVPTLADLPHPVDALLVAIPAAGVPEVLEAAGALGCGGAIVLSAGFAEVASGVELQADLVAAADRYSLPVCGPNCNGIVAMHERVALWGDALAPREPGAVAVISQSGNVAVNALAARRGLRFHTVIASGNQAVLGVGDFLEFLAGEPGLRSIALYLEDDGGPRLCAGLAACAEAGISLSVLKVGSSVAGSRAAAAHSAALAGDQRVFRSLIEEAGAAWADDVHELLELAKCAAVPAARARAASPAVRARAAGLAIMTCSGGDSAQGADEAERRQLTMPRFQAHTEARLAELLPRTATVANPLDYTTLIWGDGAALSELVHTVGADPAIGQLLVFYDQPPDLDGAAGESWRGVREGLIAGAARCAVPVMVCSTLPELLDDAAAWRFAEAGVAAVAGLRTGFRCALAMRTGPGDPVRLRAIAAAAGAIRGRGAREAQWLAEDQAKALLQGAGVNIVEGRVVTGADDAAAALHELGAPVAVKLSASSIQHKSELGGVVLGVSTEAEVRAGFAQLSALAEAHDGRVLVERMAPAGVELVIAAHTDGVVPALVIGLGGVWTELLDDVAVVPLPADAARVERALRSLRGAPLLSGGRGTRGVDLEAAAELGARLGALLLEQRSLELIECNPVLVGPQGAVAVDATARRVLGDREGDTLGVGSGAA